MPHHGIFKHLCYMTKLDTKITYCVIPFICKVKISISIKTVC